MTQYYDNRVTGKREAWSNGLLQSTFQAKMSDYPFGHFPDSPSNSRSNYNQQTYLSTPSVRRDDDDAFSTLATIAAVEVIADSFSSPSVDTTPAPDFSGGGGDFAGGGADGSW